MHALSRASPLAAPRGEMRAPSRASRAAQCRSAPRAVRPGARRPAAPRAVAAPPETLPGDVIQYVRPPSLPRVRAPPGAAPILILPGFGNESADYTAPFGVEEASVAAALRSRGYSVHVLPLERKDWFQVAGGLFSPNFYRGQCTADEGYGWYLRRVDAALRRVREATGAERAVLVGHSAGGWLARAYTGDARYGATEAGPAPGVAAVLSLGTPHLPPPPGVFDVTRGALSWLNDTLPGSHYARHGVKYVSVAGRTVRARADAEAGPVRYATTSYGALLGDACEGAVGDAVVPTACALLPGATQLVLDGVWHSMSKVGTFDEASNAVWYGSDAVCDHWLQALHAEDA